jgi:hypothetical protein
MPVAPAPFNQQSFQSVQRCSLLLQQASSAAAGVEINMLPQLSAGSTLDAELV